MSIDHKTMVDTTISDTGLNAFLDRLKMSRNESASNEMRVLIVNLAEMTGISINRIDRMLSNDDARAEYGLGGFASKSICRTVEHIGRNVDDVVGISGAY